MSKPKHTPGPWTLIDRKRGPDGNQYARFWIKGADGSDVSEANMQVGSSSPQPDDVVAEANARLIAAAPEMLELLKAIYKAASDGEKMSDGAGKHRMLKNIQFNAAQAIAKAEGGSNE